MGTNEFYYNGTEKITSEEAHALIDKSKLVVSDKPITKETKSKKESKKNDK